MSAGNERVFIGFLQSKEKGRGSMVSAKEKYRRGIEGAVTKGGRPMKCPLMLNTRDQELGLKLVFPAECLKEECAWWDGDLSRCAVLTIAKELEYINAGQTTIIKKMPHEKQFRK